MTIKAGDKLPSVGLYHMAADGPQEINTEALCSGKKVVLFGLPGAFTPTCSNSHLPGYVANADKIRAKGVDDIICVSVNDAFVMAAWGAAHNAEGSVQMVADGNGAFAKAAGLELDLTGLGLGVRSQRFAMIVDDATVTSIEVEPDPRQADVSGAESVLARL